MGDENEKPLRLLSLDGGGIRGLSSLLILRHLMKRINKEKPPKPCDYFDLIGGTSTGGLIAIMLGRLRMDIDDCISKYQQISATEFKVKRSKADVLGRGRDIWKARGRYQGDALVEEFKGAAANFEDNEDATLFSEDSSCRVFVCTFQEQLNSPVRLRSYVTDEGVESISTSKCTIWEAARATSAAATFFDPMPIGQQTYVDGATGFNNPVEAVLEEARSIWPDALRRIESVISVGTGQQQPQGFGNDMVGVLKTLKNISTDTERPHERFLVTARDLGLDGRYFRFNVDRGLENVRLGDHDKTGIIEAATQAYLTSPQFQALAPKFASLLSPGDGFVAESQKDKYLGWLPSLDPREFHEEARKHKKTNTAGDWFMKGDFLSWRDGSSSLMWLYAKAGSGKTVLTSTIIDTLESFVCKDQSRLLVYFYFTFQRVGIQSLRAVKISLLVQIVRELAIKNAKLSHVYIHPEFRRLCDNYYPSTTPKEEDLDLVLLKILGGLGGSFIVIDALDECDSPTLQLEVLEFLTGLVQNVPHTRLLVTSRPEQHIITSISELKIPKRLVPFDTHGVDHDIQIHLFKLMDNFPYKRWTPVIQHMVIADLVARSNGVFRWADLQIQGLGKFSRKPDVDKALKDLPKDLNQTYERMLRDIDEHYVPEATSMLKWLCYSSVPLTVAQLGEIAAFRVRSETKDGTDPRGEAFTVGFDPDYRFDDPSEILGILSGLITVVDYGDAETDHRGKTVTFAHFSVRQYLESQHVFPPNFQMTLGNSEWFMFKSSAAYINHYDASDTCKVPYPLLIEASYHMWMYGRDLSRESEEGLRHIIGLLEPHLENRGYALWLALNYQSLLLPAIDLCEAAAVGDTRLLQFLMDAGIDAASAYTRKGTPLHRAIDGNLGYPRFQEVPELTVETVTCLLTAKNISRSTATPCLFATATDRQKAETVKWLLRNTPVDINKADMHGDTAFIKAARAGHLEILRLLLSESGVNVNSRDRYGWGLLVLAIKSNNEALLKIALGCEGIDLELEDHYGWMPLEWSVFHGRETMTELLLSSMQSRGLDMGHARKRHGLISFDQTAELAADMSEVWSVKFSHDGTKLAVSGSSQDVSIWNPVSGEVLCSLKGHMAGVGRTSWSLDDSKIVTCSQDGYARLFSSEVCACMQPLQPPGRYPNNDTDWRAATQIWSICGASLGM